MRHGDAGSTLVRWTFQSNRRLHPHPLKSEIPNYQEIAINRAIVAIAGGRRRSLLTIDQLLSDMKALEPGQFKARLDAVKKRHADTTLGKVYRRGGSTARVTRTATALESLHCVLRAAIVEGNGRLADLRAHFPAHELKVPSNMCLALTTRENRRLCADVPRSPSQANDETFRRAYDGVAALLRDPADARRAVLRKGFGPDSLADLAELCTSIATDDGVRAYKNRSGVAIAL